MNLLSFFAHEYQGIPYIIIPFILCTISILTYYIIHRNSLTKQISRLPHTGPLSLTEDTRHLYKNLNFKVFVTNFIILLLFLELVVNTIRAIVYFIPRPDILLSYNLTENCHIDEFPVLVALLSTHYWFLFLPTQLVIPLQLSLLPIIYLLLAVLRKIFLDSPYKRMLKIGFNIIIARFVVCVILLSTFSTHILFIIPYILTYWTDFILYLYYARAFHILLRQRRNEARIHSSYSPDIFKESSFVLFQFRVTTTCTTSLVLVNLLMTSISKTNALVYFIIINPCYFSIITSGYFPVLHFSDHVQNIASVIFYGTLSFCALLLYLYVLLLFLAYLSVCILIIIKHVSLLRNQKRIPQQIAPILFEYHKDFPAYNY